MRTSCKFKRLSFSACIKWRVKSVSRKIVDFRLFLGDDMSRLGGCSPVAVFGLVAR